MSDKPVKDYDKFVLRMPDGMREAVAEQAKNNGRSMNAEIVQILEDALNANESSPEIAKFRQEITSLKLMIQLQERTIELLQQAALLDKNPQIAKHTKNIKEQMESFLGEDLNNLLKDITKESDKSDK